MYIFILQFVEYMYMYIVVVIIPHAVKAVYACFDQNEKVFVFYTVLIFNDIRIMILPVLYTGRIRFETLELKLLSE